MRGLVYIEKGKHPHSLIFFFILVFFLIFFFLFLSFYFYFSSFLVFIPPNCFCSHFFVGLILSERKLPLTFLLSHGHVSSHGPCIMCHVSCVTWTHALGVTFHTTWLSCHVSFSHGAIWQPMVMSCSTTSCVTQHPIPRKHMKFQDEGVGEDSGHGNDE